MHCNWCIAAKATSGKQGNLYRSGSRKTTMGIYGSPVPRPPQFVNTPTRPATILSGTRSSLLIEIPTGTHVGSRKLSTYDFTIIQLTGIVELKFLKHGCSRSKNTTTGERYNSAPLREDLLAGTTGTMGGCTNHSRPCDINDAVQSVDLIN